MCRAPLAARSDPSRGAKRAMNPTNVPRSLPGHDVPSARPADASARAELLRRVESLFRESLSFSRFAATPFPQGGPINGIPEHEVAAWFQLASLPASGL